MVSTRATLNICLLALLLAAQTVLVVHDAAPHDSSHTADCQLCAHAAGAGHVLPTATTAASPAILLSPPPPVFTRHTASTRIHSHHARAPPIELV